MELRFIDTTGALPSPFYALFSGHNTVLEINNSYFSFTEEEIEVT